MKNLKEKSEKSARFKDYKPLIHLKHVAIIMDGNGRWAEARGLSRIEGHKASRKAIKEAVIAAFENNIEVLSLFAFSTENWKRPKSEIYSLFRIFSEIIKEEIPELKERNVKVRYSGTIEKLPIYLRSVLKYAEDETKLNTELILNICIDYSGKNEILRAVKKVLADHLDIKKLDEKTFENYLYTKDLPPVDLLIRTSGEQRISNFMLWQIAYAELYFTNVLWPDFSKKDFEEALNEYRKRNRRFGGLNKIAK